MTFDDLAIKAARTQFEKLGRAAVARYKGKNAIATEVDVIIDEGVTQYPADDPFSQIVRTMKSPIITVHVKREQVSDAGRDDEIQVDDKFYIVEAVLEDDGFVVSLRAKRGA